MLSPLQLKGHRFTSLELHSHPKGLSQGAVEVSTQLGWARLAESPNDWRVTLRVSFGPADPKTPAPYHGTTEIVGLFTVDPAWPAAKTEELVRVNGASLLYGAIRETLLTLTTRATHGEFLMPTLSFIETKAPATPPVKSARRKTARLPR